MEVETAYYCLCSIANLNKASLVLALVLGIFGSAASAGNMPDRPYGYYPDGFPGFCKHYPDECLPATPATISPAKWKDILVRVNRDVNQRIKYRAEPEGSDEWVINPQYGDCEDYAITKLRELEDLGLPRGAMRLAVVKSRRTGRHLVLIVSTDEEEDRVLDSDNKFILTPDKTIYEWLDVQDAANPFIWWKVARD